MKNPFFIKNMLHKEALLTKLADNASLKKEVSAYLSVDEIARLTAVSKKLSIFFKPFCDNARRDQSEKQVLADRAILLDYVAQGRQAEAEQLLEETKKRGNSQEQSQRYLLSLLSFRGKVTDLSGRTFLAITPFQYALWALDRHMWKMLLNYLTKAEAFKQFQEHEIEGVCYQLKGRKTMIREKHYDFSVIQALQAYVNVKNQQRNAHSPEMTNDFMTAAWYRVGFAQRFVPAHVAQEYLRYGRPFCEDNYLSIRDFKETRLSRALTFLLGIGTPQQSTSWFSEPTLGFFFAIYRGNRRAYALGTPQEHLVEGWFLKDGALAFIDLEAMTKLRQVRTEEYVALSKRLVTTPEMNRS